jgi:hypothetical protein
MTVHLHSDGERQWFAMNLHPEDVERIKMIGSPAFVCITGRDDHGNGLQVFLEGESARDAHRVLGEYLKQMEKQPCTDAQAPTDAPDPASETRGGPVAAAGAESQSSPA